MKRLLVLVAVLVPLSLFVAGCGGGTPGKGPGEAKKAEMKEMGEKMQQMMKSGKMGTGATPGEAEKK